MKMSRHTGRTSFQLEANSDEQQLTVLAQHNKRLLLVIKSFEV